MRLWELDSGCYPFPIHLFVASRDELKEYLGKQYGVGNASEYAKYDGCALWMEKDGSKLFLVWLERFQRGKPEHYGNLAHELHHIVEEYFRELNEKNPGGEATAYFMDFLYRQSIECLWGKKKSKGGRSYESKGKNLRRRADHADREPAPPGP